MKYLIFAVALIYTANAATCQIYGCSTLPTPAQGQPNQCVGTVPEATTTNVNSCPSGQFCNYANQPFTAAQIGNSTCMNIPNPPAPTPVNNIIPGDVCNATRQDTCNAGKCTNSVCVSNNVAGSTCAADGDCPVGNYCAAQKCAAIVAPGGACTPGASLTAQVSQCGFQGRCINSVCVLPYSIASGADTKIPVATVGGQSLANMMCATGYADSTKSTTGNFICTAGQKNDPNNLNGGTTAATCTVTTTLADGTTSTSENTATCGYN